MMWFIKYFTLLSFAICATKGAKILGVFPVSSWSQWYQGHRLLGELAAKGHEITMISSIQDTVPIKNYRQILVEEAKFENLGKFLLYNTYSSRAC